MATKKREISIKASDRSSRKKGRGKRTNERRERAPRRQKKYEGTRNLHRVKAHTLEAHTHIYIHI